MAKLSLKVLENRILELESAVKILNEKFENLPKERAEKLQHDNDPTIMVEIACEKNKMGSETSLDYTPHGAKELVVYEPKIDSLGRPHYELPYSFAAGLLSGNGGKKFFLCTPERVFVTKRFNGIEKKQVEILSNSDFTPIF